MSELDMEFLGLPPTVNHMYRTGNRSRYKTLEVREYQQYVVNKLREAWTGRKTLRRYIEHKEPDMVMRELGITKATYYRRNNELIARAREYTE